MYVSVRRLWSELSRDFDAAQAAKYRLAASAEWFFPSVVGWIEQSQRWAGSPPVSPSVLPSVLPCVLPSVLPSDLPSTRIAIRFCLSFFLLISFCLSFFCLSRFAYLFLGFLSGIFVYLRAQCTLRFVIHVVIRFVTRLIRPFDPMCTKYAA
jgi:hypothetical protein